MPPTLHIAPEHLPGPHLEGPVLPPKRSQSEADVLPGSPDRKRARTGDDGKRKGKTDKSRNKKKKRKMPIVGAAAGPSRQRSSVTLSPERATAPPSLAVGQEVPSATLDLDPSAALAQQTVVDTNDTLTRDPEPSTARATTTAPSEAQTGLSEDRNQRSTSTRSRTLEASPESKPMERTPSITRSNSPAICKAPTPKRSPSSLKDLLNPITDHERVAGPSHTVQERSFPGVHLAERPPSHDKGKGKAVDEQQIAVDSQLSQELSTQSQVSFTSIGNGVSLT
jgi:hypothetical protein